jgi:hypothetical protein
LGAWEDFFFGPAFSFEDFHVSVDCQYNLQQILTSPKSISAFGPEQSLLEPEPRVSIPEYGLSTLAMS